MSATEGRRWRVSFEMIGPYATDWHPVTRETADEQDARRQVGGLQELQRQGEPVRNVRLETTTTSWVEAES